MEVGSRAPSAIRPYFSIWWKRQTLLSQRPNLGWIKNNHRWPFLESHVIKSWRGVDLNYFPKRSTPIIMNEIFEFYDWINGQSCGSSINKLFSWTPTRGECLFGELFVCLQIDEFIIKWNRRVINVYEISIIIVKVTSVSMRILIELVVG